MPLKKKKEIYALFFRVSSIWESDEDKRTVLNVTAEIIPRYESGLPQESDPELPKELEKAYEKYKSYIINKTGVVIRDLAIEVLILSDKEDRAEKMRDLKLVLLEEEADYSTEHYMLEIALKFKPLIKPVFENDFYHSGLVWEEELGKKRAESGLKKLKKRPASPVFKLVKEK